MQCEGAVLRSDLCPVRLYNIFAHYLIHGICFLRFRNNIRNRGGVVSPTPNPQQSWRTDVFSVGVVSLRVRLHGSQNRHNTANQHLSGFTLQERVATFKLTIVLSIATTFEFFAHCSRYFARLSARNKLTLFAPDSWRR